MAGSRRHFGSVRKLPSGRCQASFWHEGERHLAPGTYGLLSKVETEIRGGDWIDPSAWQETFGRAKGMSVLRQYTTECQIWSLTLDVGASARISKENQASRLARDRMQSI